MTTKKKQPNKKPTMQQQIDILKKEIDELRQRQPVISIHPSYPKYPPLVYPDKWGPIPWSPFCY